MDKHLLDYELRSAQAFLLHTASVFDDRHADTAPWEGAFTVTNQLAHIALTLDWFVEGATRAEGFDMNFEDHYTAIYATKTLAEAREQLDRSFAQVREWLRNTSDAELSAPLPAGPVLP